MRNNKTSHVTYAYLNEEDDIAKRLICSGLKGNAILAVTPPAFSNMRSKITAKFFILIIAVVVAFLLSLVDARLRLLLLQKREKR